MPAALKTQASANISPLAPGGAARPYWEPINSIYKLDIHVVNPVIDPAFWFAARPSGTEDIYKLYAERFQGEAHLNSFVSQAQELVNRALN